MEAAFAGLVDLLVDAWALVLDYVAEGKRKKKPPGLDRLSVI